MILDLEKAVGAKITSKQKDQLQQYVDMLLKWNKAINLIGKSTEQEVWKRHILDSAQLIPHIKGASEVLDFGCGAGLPAIVLAILGNANVTACDKVKKKTDFILEVRHSLGLEEKLDVFAKGAGLLEGQGRKFDVITARAVAPLVMLVGMTEKLVSDEGRFVFLKGEETESELKHLRLKYNMTEERISSITSRQGEIVILSYLK